MNNIDKVVEKLIQSTIDNAIVWNKKTSTAKRHSFVFNSNDNLTRFEFEIDLNDDLKPNNSYLWVYHKDLVDGSKLFSEYKLKIIISLRDLLYDRYVKPELKNYLDESTLFESMLDGIGDKQFNRDFKLNTLLEEDVVEKPVIEEVKVKKRNWFGF